MQRVVDGQSADVAGRLVACDAGSVLVACCTVALDHADTLARYLAALIALHLRQSVRPSLYQYVLSSVYS